MTRAWRCGQSRGDVLAAAATAAHVHAHGVRRRQRLSRVLQRGGGGGRGDGRHRHGARGVVAHGGRATHHVRVAVPIREVGRLEVARRGRRSVHGRGGGGGGGHGALLVVVMVVVVVLQEVVVRGIVRLGGRCSGGGRGGNLVRRGRAVVGCRRGHQVRRRQRRRRRGQDRRGSAYGRGGDVVALLGHAAAEGRHGGNRVVVGARVGNGLLVAVVCEDGVFPVNLGNTKLSAMVEIKVHI